MKHFSSADEYVSEEEKSSIIRRIFEHIDVGESKSYNSEGDSVEIMIEDLFGTAWINISYSKWYKKCQSAILVEKYYEKEFVQDEYGEAIPVDIDWQNPQNTIDRINAIVKKWIGQNKKQAGYNTKILLSKNMWEQIGYQMGWDKKVK